MEVINLVRKDPEKDATVHIVVDKSMVDQMNYWQRKKGFKTQKAFITACIKQYIAFANGDYELPSAEIQRMNQMITQLTINTKELRLLRSAINNGFTTILRLDDDE